MVWKNGHLFGSEDLLMKMPKKLLKEMREIIKMKYYSSMTSLEKSGEQRFANGAVNFESVEVKFQIG